MLPKSTNLRSFASLTFLEIALIIFQLIFVIRDCYCQDLASHASDARKEYIIASILDPPFLMEKKTQSKTTVHENEKYEGFSKDLADNLAHRLKFSYTFDVSSKTYGQEFRRNGTWSGIIELLRHPKDEGPQCAIGPITISQARAEVVTFSQPFMEFQYALLMKKPFLADAPDPLLRNNSSSTKSPIKSNHDDYDEFFFLQPMSPLLWLAFVSSIVFTGILFYGVEKLIIGKAETRAVEITTINFTEGGADASHAEKVTNSAAKVGSTAGRFLQVILWIYLAMFIAAYIANLSAARTAKGFQSYEDEIPEEINFSFDPESLQPKVNTIEELTSQDEIKFAPLSGGSTYEYFARTTNPKLRKAYSIMSADGIPIRSISEGVQKVRDGHDYPFAFIMEEPTARAIAGQAPCDLIVSTELFGPKLGFGVAMSKNAGLPLEFIREINLAILDMKESEELDRLERKWFQDRDKCTRRLTASNISGKSFKMAQEIAESADELIKEDEVKSKLTSASSSKQPNHNALRIEDLLGLFYVLVGALILALFIGIAEIFFGRK